MNILGISAYYHDSAACLVRDGCIVAAAQEERFTRRKHDEQFPRQAVQFCLRQGGISEKDLDCLVYYEKPFIKFDRILHTFLAYAPAGLHSFLKAVPLWIKDRIWIKSELQRELRFSGTILFPEHHESHAAAAFYPSPFEKAAFLTVDGVGEWATTSYGVGIGNEIDVLGEMRFPHSLGLLYSAFTYYAGFKVNSGEYKLMGLAPYGEPAFKNVILSHLIDLKQDGSFRLNMDYFDYGVGRTMTNSRFHALLGGPPRVPESKLTQRDMDLARSIQEVIEEAMLRLAAHVAASTGQRNLCLGGGVALNCVANGRILAEKIFDRLWIQPAAGDAGSALGAALLAWYQYAGNPRRANEHKDSQQASLLGPSFTDDEIRAFLRQERVPFVELSDEELPERVADLIAGERVIGWFQGRMEFGPRALGARSILGDARSEKMQEVMNLKIKFRESFRPFAPSVLNEKAKQYFDLLHESPYMLLVASLKSEQLCSLPASGHSAVGLDKLKQRRSSIPAVTHVDNSARVQTVTREDHPRFYDVIEKFEKKHGCPVIINTSFNVRGEPIVCSPQDAYRCFRRTNMDFLVLNRFLLEKRQQLPLDKDAEWLKEFELD